MVFEQIDAVEILGRGGWFESIGGFDFILPFLLIFAIVFAILDQLKLFGAKKNINAILAIVISIFAISNDTVIEVIHGSIPRVSMIVLFIFAVLLLTGIFGVRAEGFNKIPFGIAVIASIIAVIWAFGAAQDWDVPWADVLTQQDIGILITLGVLVLIIWFIVRDPEKPGGAVKDFFSKLFELGQGKRE